MTVMAILEFFIPSRAADLDDASKSRQDHYSVDLLCEFDVPPRQQLDDLTRMFDSLHREKSPTALFTKPELFSALFSYVKAMQERGDTVEVCRQARHKICHEIGERFKKLLQITIAYVKKRGVESENSALELCLRSTLKMYVFILCTILSSSAPADDDEGGATLSQRVSRKRKRREVDAGFCDDASGVDMDGRELVLTSLIELCSPEILQLWPNGHLEDGAYSTILKMALNMITQKTNISNDSQSIAGALALLLARVSTCTLMKNEELNSSDFVSPLIELSMKSDCAALFLSKFVSDLEQEEAASELRDSILRALFDNMSRAALFDASNDGAGAKNIASFFTEVAKKSVSVTVKMADCIIPILQSDNYDIRKAVITCITEMVLQIYTGPSRCASDAATRNGYLNELLFRIMDVNPFVRNHTLHSWERLIDSKSVPKRYYLAVTEAVVGRLEDRNYLVRDSAMAVICSLMRKNWFGQVLNNILVEQKLSEAIASAQEKFQSELLESSLVASRRHFQPISETNEDPLGDDIPPTEEEVTLSEEQTAIISKIIFFESALVFIGEMNKALSRATILLDSRTERDVVEAIKLIVVCSEYRLEASDKAFLKVLVMVFEGEVKIQLAVRDAFAEVVLAAFSRSQGSSTTRTTASAQKLIAVLRSANEGEISAVDRIFGLLKLNPSYSRHIATKFIEALWGIAEGSIDADASTDDRRTAMHVYSILSKHFWKDLRTRRDSIIDFLNSGAKLDNVLVSFVFRALQNESADPQYIPIETNVNPKHHVVLKHIVTHLCRPTTAVASWMCLAEAAISTIHHLCSVPVTMFNYVLDYLGKFANSRDTNRRAQLFFVVGHTALKQLVAVESAEKQQLKALEEPAKNSAQATAPTDTMHKELGLGSHEYKRHAIQDLAQKRKQAIMQDGSRWLRYSTEVLDSCKLRASDFDEKPYERVCAVMAMCHLMIVSETFCSENLDLLFKIVSDKRESWVVKTNAVIALGDLCCVHPNLLGPYLSVPSAGFLRLLVDDDLRVRAVTIQVCSHLVLGEMLRIRDHLHTIIKLVADPDETIAQNAVTFVQNLALKEKEKTGNLIPPLVSQLSGVMPQDKFRIAMRHLLERVEGDKPTDSLIDRLCQRFDPFSERSKKKRQLAQNIAFCLSELNYTTERSMKRLTSEPCYQQYKHWIRDPEVFEFFKLIAAKAKRTARGGAVTTDQRRDKTLVEEWECRLMLDHSGEPRAGEAQIVDCPSDEDAC